MELVSTPEPHFIPGYTGHCPQYLYRVGKTYGNQTHKLLIDPCVHHSPKLLVSGSHGTHTAENKPTLKEIDLIKTHERESEAVLKYPIIPGYDGFIPNIHSKIGDRFLAAATAGVAEHERYMQQLKCERRNLKHRNLLQSGEGLYGRNLGEISMQQTIYQLPLIPVRKEAEGIRKTTDIQYDARVPYSKHTPPHFMVDKNPEKYVMKGYGGHIPMTLNRFGENNKALTANALCEFSNDYQQRKSSDWISSEKNAIGTLGSFKIYHRKTGMIPSYAGHVPGEIFKFGSTYEKNTIDAKKWLEEQF